MTDLAEIAERFARETANHKMTVLHDDGVYRHLRFRGERSFYWFSLITAPGSLIFQGDGDSFVFSRTEDMFEFFRGQRVNPGYWTEKITSGQERVMRYERAVFMAQVNQAVRAVALEGLAAAVHDSLAEADAEGFLDYEEPAREWLRDFEFWSDPDAERGGRYGIVDGKYAWIPRVSPDFRFEDTWEWNLRDYDWWILWALHAIVWGIARYDATKGPVNYDVAKLLAPGETKPQPAPAPTKPPALVIAETTGGVL